jgi:uracil-DNA glycosylase
LNILQNNFLRKTENYFNKIRSESGEIILIDKPGKIFSHNNSGIHSDNNEQIQTNDKMNRKQQKHVIIDEKTDLFQEEPKWKKSLTMDDLYSQIHDCTICPLGSTRKNFVFGSGNPNADIMVIGEAPGADEDEQGLPFVGRAGQLLTKILEAINLSREEVFICNIIKCRPPQNRVPNPIEVESCEPYLMKQIELIKPEFILALGLTAVDTLLKKKHKMGDIRGSIMNYHGIKMLVTYHPAALLRNPEWKKHTWEDVKNLRRLYDEYLNKR